jgi:hypothetical protein
MRTFIGGAISLFVALSGCAQPIVVNAFSGAAKATNENRPDLPSDSDQSRSIPILA